MLAQYRDCFGEVSRQTQWYRDLRDAYQDLRSHAENIKREALLSVSAAQKELEAAKKQILAQSAQIAQLKEQVWATEHDMRRSEFALEEEHQKLTSQISALKQQVDSLQSQLKEAKEREDFSEEQEELRQLREFRDKCERAARSVADIEQQDKDCWGGLSWCESTESEDSQKREARLQATLGLLLVEAGRRRAVGGRDPSESVKDSDSDSTDHGEHSKRQQQNGQGGQGAATEQDSQLDSSKCRVHGVTASAAWRYQRESAERRRRLEQEKKNRALRNVARCEACRSFVKSPGMPPESDPRARRSAPACGCHRGGGRLGGAAGAATSYPGTTKARLSRKGPPPAQYAPILLGGPRGPCAPAAPAEPGDQHGVEDPGAKQEGEPELETEETSTTDTGGSEQGPQGAVVKQLFLAPKLQARLHGHPDNPPQSRTEEELKAQVEVLRTQVESLQAELQCLGSCASVRVLQPPVLDKAVLTDSPWPEAALLKPGTVLTDSSLLSSSAPVDSALKASPVPLPEAKTAMKADAHAQTQREESAESLVEPNEVRALAEEARRELKEAARREAARRGAGAGAAQAVVLRALCGAELEARLRDAEAERLRERFLEGLRGALASALSWRQHARRLERYCSSKLWSPQGQLQGALEDNRELREQLRQLREHNATLASQLQSQCVESARFLSELSSSPLEDEMACSLESSSPPRPRAASSSRHRALATLAEQVHCLNAEKQALVEQNRALRCLRCSAALSRASRASTCSRDSDPCDSGCWSLQASPPRSVPAVSGPSLGPSPARLCWVSPSAPLLEGPTQTPSGATAFILNARRPRGAASASGPGAGARNS